MAEFHSRRSIEFAECDGSERVASEFVKNPRGQNTKKKKKKKNKTHGILVGDVKMAINNSTARRWRETVSVTVEQKDGSEKSTEEIRATDKNNVGRTGHWKRRIEASNRTKTSRFVL